VGLDKPVDNISWTDGYEFIQALNQLEVGTFRMPTEAEWEYACRAGTQTRFYWGDDPNAKQIDQFAWYAERESHEVGMKSPNKWNLYDMSGNVWEFCSDKYTEDYYTHSPPADPLNTNKESSYRIVRGGSWVNNANVLRSARRGKVLPTESDPYIGLRVVMIYEP
jgi:formylglycine-generating enzyme required for sulfatase activity